MTSTPDTLDLATQPYSLLGVLNAAITNNLCLDISTVEGITTTGTPVQCWTGVGGDLVTLTDRNDDLIFLPVAHITKIALHKQSRAYFPKSR